MSRLLLLAALASLALVAMAPSCGSASPRAVATPLAPSPRDVYARMAAALTQPDAVFHAVLQSTSTEGPHSVTRRSEIWLDLASQRARSEIGITFEGIGTSHATWLIDGATWYQTQSGAAPRKREATVCHGAPDAVMSLLLECHGFFEQSATTVEQPLTFDDHPALALVTTGNVRGAGENQSFEDHLYIDAETYLPIAFTSDGIVEGASSVAVHTIERFENTFVPVASLAPDHFAPASIGYAEPSGVTSGDDLSAAAGISIVQMDLSFAPGTDLPVLVLASVSATSVDARALVGYRATLAYRRADREFAPVEITLRDWRVDEWGAAQASRNDWRASPCTHRTEIALAAGDATVLAGYAAATSVSGSCPTGDPDLFAAEARIAGAVVEIEPADGGAYSSAVGMQAVVGALTVFAAT